MAMSGSLPCRQVRHMANLMWVGTVNKGLVDTSSKSSISEVPARNIENGAGVRPKNWCLEFWFIGSDWVLSLDTLNQIYTLEHSLWSESVGQVGWHLSKAFNVL